MAVIKGVDLETTHYQAVPQGDVSNVLNIREDSKKMGFHRASLDRSTVRVCVVE